ncbi:MAG: Stp1/IreP family PP2C-type Ser/Thr phosphatase [Elusimicrobia bacterium]|nr:Stp1/IreP family PP2C-type Ser/Thr phosphatase [Elusimicrobiota bacterium]
MSPLEIAGKTDPGKVRERNEDSLGLIPELGLAVVADGMGGHNSGEVASSLAVDTILAFARDFLGGGRNAVPEGGDASLSPRARQLTHFIESANTVIFEKSRAFKKDQGMGTTVVAALADEKGLTVAHVGDSRLYVLRGGSIERLTEDHSLVQDQVRHGLITPEQADKSHLQNILTRALGTEEKVKVDVSDHPVLPGDVFMLCSDGLTKMVSEPEMQKVLASTARPLEAVDELIRRANDAGGVDNVTVAVIRPPGSAPESGWRRVVSRFFGG